MYSYLLQISATPLAEPILKEWGLWGVIVLALAGVVVYLYIANEKKDDKRQQAHKDERAEMRKDFLNELEKLVAHQKEDRKEFTDAIKENTKLLYDVKAARG